MLPFKTLISIDKTKETPVYQQLANGLIFQIKRGVLSTGTKLPGTRQMAILLNIHRKTVIAAYEELQAQGWLEFIASKGTFVSKKIPEIKPQKVYHSESTVYKFPSQTGYEIKIDRGLNRPIFKSTGMLEFNDGMPDLRLIPVKEIAATYRNIMLRKSNIQLSYGDTYGNEALRRALVKYLNESRGFQCSINNILITRGTIMGLYLSSSILLQGKEIAVVGELSYGGADIAFQKNGARLIRIPVDQEGLNVVALEEVCKRNKVRVVYVTPHHHYPTTVTLSAQRRIQLLALAEEYGFAIIEDDYDYDFHYAGSPILPLATADTKGMVIYIGSFTKSISPAIRIGYMVAPDNLIEEAARLRRIIDRQGDVILEQALAELIQEGQIQRHHKKALKLYHHRRDYCCQILKNNFSEVLDFDPPQGGLAIWAKFKPEVDLIKVAEKALKKGLYISNGVNYDPNLKGFNATRMGFAALEPDELLTASEILLDSLK